MSANVTSRQSGRQRRAEPTIAEVARRADVSVATVSRAFNEPEAVVRQTREKILRCAREAGYYPRVVPNRRNKVAVLIDAPESLSRSGYMAELIGVACEEMWELKLRPTLLPLSDVVDDAGETAPQAHGFWDGALALSYRPANLSRWTRGRERVPAVVVNDACEPPCMSVRSDHAQGGRLAASRLIERGHRRIAYIGHDNGSQGARDRLNGFLAARAEACGPEADEAPVIFREEIGLLEALSECRRKATAVVLGGQGLALPALRILHVLGVRVPEDLSVAGFEARGISEHLSPPLSAVRQPIAELARRAVRLLAEAMAGNEPASREVVLENDWIERQSVATLR